MFCAKTRDRAPDGARKTVDTGFVSHCETRSSSAEKCAPPMQGSPNGIYRFAPFETGRTADRRQVIQAPTSACFTSRAGEGTRTLDIQLGKQSQEPEFQPVFPSVLAHSTTGNGCRNHSHFCLVLLDESRYHGGTVVRKTVITVLACLLN